MKNSIVVLCLAAMSLIGACTSGETPDLFAKENLVAWCIVPFDAKNRSPEERALMLNELGISSFAYDYRDRHISSFAREIEVLRRHQIGLSAVWLWVDPEHPLSEATQTIIGIVEESGTKTEFWVGMPDAAFDGRSDEESLSLALKALRTVLKPIEAAGCTLALYNHGGWYGEPENQVRIIQALGSEKLGMVYNFHHGHHQLSRFEANLELMLPYLTCININGMRAEGPKIITVGEGRHELEMLGIIQASGYDGPIGILGHTEGEDIRKVLERNLQGLEALQQSLTTRH